MSIPSAFDELMQAHRGAASPVPSCLAPGLTGDEVASWEERLGHPIPTDVAALHALADGIDLTRLDQAVGTEIDPVLFPSGLWFSSMGDAVATAASMQSAAQNASRTSVRASSLWRSSWTMAYQIWGGEAVAVDATDQIGRLVLVRWENRVEHVLDGGVEGLLRDAARLMEATSARWNDDGYFDVDEAAFERLPFPGSGVL